MATNEAKTHLSSILKKVEEGESVVITRGRKPVARLVAYENASAQRPRVGEMIDPPTPVPADALRSLTADELDAWGL